ESSGTLRAPLFANAVRRQHYHGQSRGLPPNLCLCDKASLRPTSARRYRHSAGLAFGNPRRTRVGVAAVRRTERAPPVVPGARPAGMVPGGDMFERVADLDASQCCPLRGARGELQKRSESTLILYAVDHWFNSSAARHVATIKCASSSKIPLRNCRC